MSSLRFVRTIRGLRGKNKTSLLAEWPGGSRREEGVVH